MRPPEILFKDEVFNIIGAALEILKTIGHGLHEKPYENGLVVEFELRNIPYEQQRHFPIIYKGRLLSEFIPDLIAYNSVIIDTKVIDRITDHERGQMMNYLRITGFQVGLILNFKRARLEWERIILTKNIH